jgi:S1-C subfamily serine protease
MTYEPRFERPEPAFSGVFSRSFLLALILGGLAWLFWRGERAPVHDPDAEPRLVAARGDLAQDEQATIQLFETASPSVVHINTSRRATRRDFFGTDVFDIPEGSGSGFVWDAEGHVVTNFHVVASADDAEVRLSDQTVFPARWVGGSPDHDLAVIQIDVPSARVVPIAVGTSADLHVGQKVFAIGNPFGLDQTLTTGVISGLDRQIRSVSQRVIQGVIQTDAAINPGNSGGPLLDSAGRLIGINTAIQSPSGAYAGVGFAVPVDTINRIVPMLIRDGQVRRVGLGVDLAPDDLVREMGWEGALVGRVLEGGAADAAGLEGERRGTRGRTTLGDLIVAVDGEPVRRIEDLQALLQDHEAGDEVELWVVRDPGGRARQEKVRVRLREF